MKRKVKLRCLELLYHNSYDCIFTIHYDVGLKQYSYSDDVKYLYGHFCPAQYMEQYFYQFCGGVRKIRLSLFTALIGSINIPLSILFAKYFGLGSAG